MAPKFRILRHLDYNRRLMPVSTAAVQRLQYVERLDGTTWVLTEG